MDATTGQSSELPATTGPWTQYAAQTGAASSPAAVGPWTQYAQKPDLLTDSEGHVINNPDEALKRGAAIAQPIADIVGAGIKGAVDGFGDPVGQTILSPKAQAWMDDKQRQGGVSGFLAGLGSTAAQDIGTAGGVVAGAADAAFRGAQGAVAQTGAELGAPQLGRDIAAIPEAFAGSPSDLPVVNKPLITALQVQARDGVGIMEAWNRAHAENTAQAAAAVADIGKAPDIDSAIAAAGKAASSGAPDPLPTGWSVDDRFGQTRPTPTPAADAEPVPQSVGAAASRDMTNPGAADISTADMKANRYQAEMNELLAPPAAGDKNIYVNGSLPTLAEYSGNPEISQQENLIRQRNPGEFIGEGKRLTENNAARVSEYENQTPSRTALDMMRDDRSAQWEADSRNILPNAKPADLTPAMDWVEGQLADPKIQENDAVRNVLQDFHDRLVDDNGYLKTDPAAVWGIHDNIQNQLAKAKDPLNSTGAEKYAFSELMQAKGLVDGVMNTSTNNQFQTALDNYTKASQAINAGEELESFRPKLTNASGTIMGDRFHKFVVDLATRRGDPGIDPAMSISDDTMRSMINIDNDLKRAGLIKLGAAAGSPTNLLGALAGSMGLGAAHMVAGHLAPGIGNMILHAGGDAAMGALGKYRLNKLTAKHLAPPEGGYVYPGATP